MGFFFFKLPKHYVFDYKPLYYDKKKEERKERFKKIDEKLGIKDEQKEQDSYRPNIKFRRYITYHKRSKQQSVVRLVTIVGLFVLLFLLIENLDLVEKLVDFLIKIR